MGATFICPYSFLSSFEASWFSPVGSCGVLWGASFGDAFLAALAVGGAKPGDMAVWNPVTTEIRPDPARREIYDRLYARFRGLHEAAKPWR